MILMEIAVGDIQPEVFRQAVSAATGLDGCGTGCGEHRLQNRWYHYHAPRMHAEDLLQPRRSRLRHRQQHGRPIRRIAELPSQERALRRGQLTVRNERLKIVDRHDRRRSVHACLRVGKPMQAVETFAPDECLQHGILEEHALRAYA